jgi:hypothetical protein
VERGDGDKKTSIKRKNLFLEAIPCRTHVHAHARMYAHTHRGQEPVGGECRLLAQVYQGTGAQQLELLQRIASRYIDELRRGNLARGIGILILSEEFLRLATNSFHRKSKDTIPCRTHSRTCTCTNVCTHTHVVVKNWWAARVASVGSDVGEK